MVFGICLRWYVLLQDVYVPLLHHIGGAGYVLLQDVYVPLLRHIGGAGYVLLQDVYVPMLHHIGAAQPHIGAVHQVADHQERHYVLDHDGSGAAARGLGHITC